MWECTIPVPVCGVVGLHVCVFMHHVCTVGYRVWERWAWEVTAFCGQTHVHVEAVQILFS